jgi:hypothetical protein
MVRPGDTCSSVTRLIRRYRRVALAGGLACGVAFAATPLVAEEPSTDAVPQQMVTAAPETPEMSGASATPTAMTVTKPVDAPTEKSSEQQRRVLMLLLMNSAGPVRPFGNLGR